MEDGRKNDRDKLDYTLLDPELINEFNKYVDVLLPGSTRALFASNPKDRALLMYEVSPMVDNRMYMLAAATVYVACGLSLKTNILRIMQYGAEKYANHNWKLVRPIDRYLAAGYRHLKGGTNEEDCNQPHLAHFCCNMLMMRWFERNGIRLERDQVNDKAKTLM